MTLELTWIFLQLGLQWMVLSYLFNRTNFVIPYIYVTMLAVVKLYEHKLKELNPQVRQITYDIADLNNYLDTLQDICALV